MPQKSGAKRDHSESGVTDCIQGVSAWRTSKRAGERFPIFFSKTFKKQKKNILVSKRAMCF